MDLSSTPDSKRPRCGETFAEKTGTDSTHGTRTTTFGRLYRTMALSIFVIVSGLQSPTSAQTSKLWGVNGEAWQPGSLLPDFSFAGYHCGDSQPVAPARQISIRDFGGVGDGKADDTVALKKAIAAAKGRTVLLPKGRYKISDIIEIKESRTVLRGEGPNVTIIEPQRAMNEIRPTPGTTDDGLPTNSYSWSGGMIWFRGGDYLGEQLTTPTSSAKRGALSFEVASVSKLRKDMDCVLVLKDTSDKTLVNYLYRGDGGNISGLNGRGFRQVLRVKSVSGKKVTFDRPLRVDVDAAWRPVLHKFAPQLEECGIEDLAVEFSKSNAYAGHWRELGFNAIAFQGSVNCWARNIRIANADSGIFVEAGSMFCSLLRIRIDADRSTLAPEGITGHHGIAMEGVECLCRDFTITTKFVHDLTVSNGVGNVFAHGSGPDLAFDHHCWAPYENLFTDIDAGLGARIWTSGGGGNRGKHTAAGATFWNIQTRRPVPIPDAKFAPSRGLILTGMNLQGQDSVGKDQWIEHGHIKPLDLHLAQLARRVVGEKSLAATALTDMEYEWTNREGRAFRARYGGIVAGQVRLIVRGTVYHLPITTLSEASVRQANDLARQKPLPAPVPVTP